MKLAAQKKRQLLAAVLLLAVLALGIYLLLINAVFIARDVRVVGNANIDADAIIRAAQLPLGKPMREVSEEQARAALEGDGRVELLSLEKHYPDQLVLNVRERVCDAVVDHAGVVLAVERDGTVIAQYDAVPATDAVYVTGLSVTAFRLGEAFSAPAGQFEAFTRVLNALYDNGATAYVSELNVSDPQALYLYSRTGMRVDLGDSGNMDNKTILMAGVLRDLESRGETGGRLDVSNGEEAYYKAG